METNLPVNWLLAILCGKSQVGAGFCIFNVMLHNAQRVVVINVNYEDKQCFKNPQNSRVLGLESTLD
uniref:Uncharacterized protein n=1 Tax=Glossina austeni TaxID=7395 RepID=A0A1A9UXQ1_GLOAU